MQSHSEDPSPWLIAICLSWAVTMCASAGVIFSILVNQMNVPPALCVSWRLAWVEMIQLIPFALTLCSVKRHDDVTRFEDDSQNNGKEMIGTLCLDEPKILEDEAIIQSSTTEEQLIMPRIFQALPLLILSGICLGIHFSAWVWSLQLTSLTHSMLWVSMGPVLLNAGSWVFFLCGNHGAPTCLESSGALVGFLGAVIMLGDMGQNSPDKIGQDPTAFGDFVALVGAAAVSIYLVIGRHLREWMPLWVYTFGVVGSAYITTLMLAILTGEVTFTNTFGFLYHPYVWYALYLGIGPGVGGHTLLNGLLKFISPLTVSTAMLAEPLVGSLMGYAVGMQAMPGLYTWIGGFVLLGGLALVAYGDNKEKNANASAL
jgi:drug/metabolite transporter (DMT)-like permease